MTHKLLAVSLVFGALAGSFPLLAGAAAPREPVAPGSDWAQQVFADLRTAGSTAVGESPHLDATSIGFAAPYPNPFTGSTQLSFAIPRAGITQLAIYDVSGRRVKVLLDGLLAGGTHPAVWNGRDERGAPVASGIYFARVAQRDEVATRAIALLR